MARQGRRAKDGFSNRAAVVTKQDILDWLRARVFIIVDGEIYSRKGRRLVQRINKRKRCEHGDPRVDLVYGGHRVSVHVSHLIWMWHTNCVLPDGFEIHHRDEDPMNNNWSNLIAVHPDDHTKLHANAQVEVPF